MSIDYTPPDSRTIQAVRDRHLVGDDLTLFSHIGYFLTWFAISETWITALLASVVGVDDDERFELLISGMDARVKCERLRKSAKKYWSLPPDLDNALVHFEKHSIKWRNIIAHSWPTSYNGTIYFGAYANGPVGDANKPTNQTRITPDDLFAQAMFLNGELLPALQEALRSRDPS